VLLGVSILLGGKAWMSYRQNQTLSASNIYAQMLAASQADEVEKVKAAANQLISDYSGSGYAPLAAMLLAREAVDSGELPAAQVQLQWALDKAGTDEIRHTARLRLIRLLIDEKKYADADELIASVKDAGAYAYRYSELKGDLAAVQGQREAAVAAYKQALDALPADSPSTALLNAKYESVGGEAP